MKLEVEKRNGKLLCSLDVPDGATLSDLKAAFCESHHYYPERQRWTTPTGVVLTDQKTLQQQGIKSGSTLQFKDLGIQISWRLVFVLEYLGPILIAPLCYWHHHTAPKTLTQNVALGLLLFHFLKREVETIFVHRFSHNSMPLVRLPINCGHYWILCGLAISYFLFHPMYQGPFDKMGHRASRICIYGIAGLMLIFEFLNLNTHMILRNLRPRGSKARNIPYGWGFGMVSCANYLWEICAWTMFAILVGCFTAWIFLAVATVQMTEWALKKHSAYKKEFKNYPKIRTALFPGLL